MEQTKITYKIFQLSSLGNSRGMGMVLPNDSHDFDSVEEAVKYMKEFMGPSEYCSSEVSYVILPIYTIKSFDN